MPADFDAADLPPETIVENGREWRREQVDADSFKWVREMEPDEYDWDRGDVTPVGTDVPVRVVTIQYVGGSWWVEGGETMGPDRGRPGEVEAIGDDFFGSFDDPAEAFEMGRECIERLS